METVSVSEVVKILLADDVLAGNLVQFMDVLEIPAANRRQILNSFKLEVAQPYETYSKILEKWIGLSKNGRTVGDLCASLEEMNLQALSEELRNKWSQEGLLEVSTFEKQATQTMLFGLRDKVDNFVGRKEEHEKILKAMQKEEGNRIISAAITGLGGIGKTELAISYAHQYLKNYGAIVWIKAESLDNLKDSFVRVARDTRVNVSLKTPDGAERSISEIVQEVYRFFYNGQSQSLFVFDNAERFKNGEGSTDGIEPFLPEVKSNIRILVTSRNNKWEGCSEVLIELDNLQEEEAMQLVRNSLEITDTAQEENIQELVKELQCFPLALQQAVAYIRESNRESMDLYGTQFSVSDYLQL